MWKCASSVIRRALITPSSFSISRSCSEEILRLAISWSFNSWTIAILYGWKLRSLCKILRTLRSDSPMAAECLLTERPGLFTIAILTLSTFSGVRTLAILPRGSLFKAEAFSRKFCTHSFMVLRQGTRPWRGMLKCQRNNRFVVTAESPFLK